MVPDLAQGPEKWMFLIEGYEEIPSKTNNISNYFLLLADRFKVPIFNPGSLASVSVQRHILKNPDISIDEIRGVHLLLIQGTREMKELPDNIKERYSHTYGLTTEEYVRAEKYVFDNKARERVVGGLNGYMRHYFEDRLNRYPTRKIIVVGVGMEHFPAYMP